MKRISTRAIAMALAAGSLMAITPSAASAAQKKEKAAKAEQRVESPTKAFAEGYNNTIKLIQAEDFAGAKAAFEQSAPTATAPNDMYWAGNLALQIGSKLSEQPLQKRGLEMIMNSGLASPEETQRYAFFLGQFAYKDEDYAKSVQYLQQAYDAGYRENGIAATLAEANNKAGNTDKAYEWLNTAIEAEQAAGRTAPENWYKRGAALALENKNYTMASTWLTRLVDAYPNDSNWRDTLVVFRDGVNLSKEENLDLMRLMREVNALKSERDYGEYVDAADPRKLPGEVVAVIDDAQANGVTGSTYLTEQRQIASGNIAADKAGLSGAERDARAGANGKIAAVTADAYFGYGDYAKAADLYTVALEKGGVNADEVHTRRGMARVEMGDTAGAMADFSAVESGNRAQIAKFWELYLNKQGGASAATAS